MLRNDARYNNLRVGGRHGELRPEIAARVQKYPRYDMKTPIEAFLKANKGLIKKCGGNVGGTESDVTLVYTNGSYYLVPSDTNML